MEIIKDVPPNFKTICAHFPFVAEHFKDIVFTFGETLYSPGGHDIPDHLMVHEQTHSLQQRVMGIDNWWVKYLVDDSFRLDQEVEAYARQYKFFKNKHSRQTKQFLNKIAKDLSSKMYGNLCSFERAKELITFYAN